jgi:hypothetical protein
VRTGTSRRRSSAGFALVGLLAMLAIVAMGLSVMVAFANRVLDEDRTGVVTDELEEVYRAVVGNQRDVFGYIGELGTYPNSLYDLAVNPGNSGWRGPYLRDPRVGNNMLLDPWGQPYEFWVVANVAGSDQLAIISRGPDGQSTNTAADPNVSANFTGLLPTAANYFTGDPRNADNVVFPRTDPTRADNLNINIDSILNITLNNYDSNDDVDAFVAACPGLYNLKVTNTSRGTDDVPTTAYAPGFEVTLPQGTYQVLITSALLATPLVNDRIVVFPVVPVYRTYNLTGLDSSGTDQFTLTLTNKYPLETATIRQFDTSIGTVATNATVVFNGTTSNPKAPKACSTINVVVNSEVVETFTMPFGNATKIVGATAAAVEVENDNNFDINVFRNGLFLGNIRKNRDKTFSEGLVAGDFLEAKTEGGTFLESLTLVAGFQEWEVD